MEKILVSDIMTREPVKAGPEEDLFSCAKKMIKMKVGSLIITSDKDEFLGYISQRDILWAMTKNPKSDLSKIKAIDISPKKIFTLNPKMTVKDAIQKMNSLKFDRFPVIEKNKVIGIVTAKDILNFNPELYPELEEFAQIREEQEKLKRTSRVIENDEIDGDESEEGTCEECGGKDVLTRFNGILICQSCRNSI